MAWTNLTFAYGSVLTSTKMTQMYDNMYDLHIGDSQVFTGNGTWTKPAWVTANMVIEVEVWGGGGGGTNGGTGGGGGGGAYNCVRLPASSLGATEQVTVGAGGTVGVAGGFSSFTSGNYVPAYGGGQGGTGGGGGGGGGTTGVGVGGQYGTGNGGTGFSNKASGGLGGSGTSIVGQDAPTLDCGGGGGFNGYGGGCSMWGGGGGCGSNGTTPAGHSLYGGGGGGAGTGTAGTSKYGGSGGASGVAGTIPGGGGGYSASGARGEVRVRVLA